MVSPEHGKNSNSPNVRISELKREGTDGGVLRVLLDDGSLFLLDADHPSALHLSVDLSLDPEQLIILKTASELFNCYHKALSLLARAEQCRWGLTAKLSKKGYSREAVSVSLDRLVSAGLLDDRRYAEAWVRSRLRSRPEGPSRLQGALMAKGVNSAVAREAVTSIFEELDDDDADETLERAWEKLSRRSGMKEDKLISALVRRGFRISRVRNLLKEKNQG